MKHKETIEVPATQRVAVVKVTCDLCGEAIRNGGYEIDEVTIKHRTGESYPECGSGHEVSLDVCGACFTARVLPWFESQGATPVKEAWDW